LQQLSHQCDDKRLGDRLAMAYRERSVAVSGGPVLEWHELMSRHFSHRGAHTRAEPSHATGAGGRGEHCVNLLDHPLTIGGVLFRRGSSNQRCSSQDGEYPKRSNS
jgi:hypothetical protein